MNQLRKLRDPEIIAFALGVSQAVGFAYAFIVAEGNGSPVTLWLAIIRGVFLGFALSFGLVMVSHTVPRIQAKRARILGYIALGGLMLVSPVIIAPAIQYSIPAGVLLVPAARWIWAASIAVAPDLVAIGIAVSGGKLSPVAQPEQPTGQPDNNQPQPKQPKRNRVAVVAKPELTDDNLVEYMEQPGTTQAKAAEYFGVRPQAISKRLGKIKSQAQTKGG